MTTAALPTLTAVQPMYADGPLTTPGGDLLWQVAAPAPQPRRTVTVRCLDAAGTDVADPVLLTGRIGRDALALVVGGETDGSVDAALFARLAFGASCDAQDVRGCRAAAVMRRLCDLDRLALAAAGRDIPAVVAWSTEFTETTEGA